MIVSKRIMDRSPIPPTELYFQTERTFVRKFIQIPFVVPGIATDPDNVDRWRSGDIE
jgi:hypothetical protein